MRRDFSPPPKKSKKRFYIIGAFAVIALLWFFTTRSDPPTVDKSISAVIKKTQAPFPTVSTQNLSTTQKKILQLAKQEYDKIPRSYNDTVLKYTDGNKESWCADFISWVYLKAGVPLTNPNSGYWRIPGVLTLQQYFKDTDRYVDSTANYIPKLGDIAFYIGAQTPDNSSEEHAAFVLKADKDTITTIGGNEGLGIMRIRTEPLQKHIDKGLVGFGQL